MSKIAHKNKDKKLTSSDENVIENNSNLELMDKLYEALKIASIMSIIGVSFPAWALYNNVNVKYLLSWLIAMWVVHAINIVFSIFYKHHRPSAIEIKPWISASRIAIFVSASTWGSLCFLLDLNNPQNQMMILFVLILVVCSLALGTMTDFIASIIGVGSVFATFIFWYLLQISQHDLSFNLPYGGLIICYVIFLLSISFTGYRLVKKSTILSYTNVALRKKLSSSNKNLSKANANLEHIAHHDPLTGLPNRILFSELLTSSLNEAERNKKRIAVFFIDLDGFKDVNDTFGHQVGDLLLKNMAVALKKSLRKSDVLARLGGDEFILYTPEDKYFNHRVLAQKILSAVEKKHIIEKHKIKLSASIGISIYPNDGKTAEELQSTADIAMYAAKNAGKHTFKMYHASMNEN